MPRINPSIMQWAREASGLAIEDAAKKLQFRDTKAMTAAEKLLKYESGELEPQQSLLLKMTKAYHRPLLTFYLEHPPEKGDRGTDFRRTPSDHTRAYDPYLDALVRDVLVRHELVLAAKQEEEEVVAHGFVGSRTMSDGIESVLNSITNQLSIDTDTYRSYRNVEDSFNYLRAQAERAGIFVILIGNLGHHTKTVPVSSFRGYAIANSIAPFVIINDQDSRTAWAFTLMHELAHIWLGSTGVSDGSDGIAIEKFCNEVASQFFVKKSELEGLSKLFTKNAENNYLVIESFAKELKISRSMVSYNLFKIGAFTKGQWQSACAHFDELWQQEQAQKKHKSSQSTGGVDYYRVRNHRLGKALVGFVKRAIDENILTPTKAGRVLGVKPRAVSLLTNRSFNNGGVN